MKKSAENVPNPPDANGRIHPTPKDNLRIHDLLPAEREPYKSRWQFKRCKIRHSFRDQIVSNDRILRVSSTTV
jgi:hypothetical protein